MTVKELREALENVPDDARITFDTVRHGFVFFDGIVYDEITNTFDFYEI